MTYAYREKLGSGRLGFRAEKLDILEAQNVYHILLKREAGYCVQLAEQVGMFS